MLLRHHGIDPAQVTQVPLGVGAAVAALNSSAVDTAYMYEPLQSKYGSKYRAIAKVSDVLPHVVSNVLIASQDFIEKEPDKSSTLIPGKPRNSRCRAWSTSTFRRWSVRSIGW